MDMQLEGQVGPETVGDGSSVPLRLAKDKSLVTSDGHGRYYENTSRGNTYTGMTALAGTTIVAANNSPVAANAASILTLFNPLGSGINLELLKSWLTFISGTPAAGLFVYNMLYNQTISAIPNNAGVSGGVPQPNYLSGKRGAGQIFTQNALTGTSSAQNLFRPFGASQFAGAIAGTSPVLNFTEELNGDIVVPPGGLLTIASPGTGTTVIVAAGFEWQEIELP